MSEMSAWMRFYKMYTLEKKNKWLIAFLGLCRDRDIISFTKMAAAPRRNQHAPPGAQHANPAVTQRRCDLAGAGERR